MYGGRASSILVLLTCGSWRNISTSHYACWPVALTASIQQRMINTGFEKCCNNLYRFGTMQWTLFLDRVRWQEKYDLWTKRVCYTVICFESLRLEIPVSSGICMKCESWRNICRFDMIFVNMKMSQIIIFNANAFCEGSFRHLAILFNIL